MKPNPDHLPDYYKAYVSLVEDKPLISALTDSRENSLRLFKSLEEEQGTHTYESGKWSVKELIQHVIDAERVFSYRALTFARNDKAELPGFEHEDWNKSSKANSRTLENLTAQYQQLSASTLLLFKSFDTEMLNRVGTASGVQFNVANLGFIIAGHTIHHVKILKEKYLK